MPFVNVAIPTPVRRAFTYALPDGLRAMPGMRVAVEFHRKRTVGVIIETMDRLPQALEGRAIKEISALLDDKPALSPALLELVRWMSDYYCAPIGEVVRAALPARLLQARAPRTTRPTEPSETAPLVEKEITLNPDQQRALDAIHEASISGKASVSLLHGITGSGKTEVYLRLFALLAKKGKQGLLLVPEIGLTPQLAGRAAARFGDRVAVYHSGLTDAQRHAQWLRMRDGGVDVVIGTRSALFAPLPNLGAIVVDEEHDASYKQDEGFSYHGRDSAVMRAHIERIVAVLGSATPSLESFANVRTGKYSGHSLPLRTAGASLPDIEIVDMRISRQRELHALSPQLFDAIGYTLDRKEQTLLFMGRRGFASSMQCEACGEVFSCPNCDIALTAHIGRGKARDSAALVCHYCDYRIPLPDSCAACGAGELTPVGHGTQRLEAEITDFFPDARVARLDSDMAQSTRERRKILGCMRDKKIDILVGTQMVTKGHDFSDITLVGVICADMSLHLPDFRAAERTFQLLTQVAGRAGRGNRSGRVIIQTYQPEHQSLVMASLHDFDGFATEELKYRQKLSYPPFGRLALVRISSNSNEAAEKAAHCVAGIVHKSFDNNEAISVLGPAPAPIARVRNRFRWQILIKAPTPGAMGRLLARARSELDGAMPRNARLAIDVDPVNLL
ncbi:MAG: primosomal protein N' [bacterium]